MIGHGIINIIILTIIFLYITGQIKDLKSFLFVL